MGIEKNICDILRHAGIQPGDRILVHSSYSSFGKAVSCPDEIIKGLLLSIGDNGTLLFPTLSYEHTTIGNPVFDVHMTRSCVGYLAEYFRTQFAHKRSLHPTHSVAALGKDTDFLLDDHIKDTTPVGEHSPFRKLRDLQGKLVFFGCGLRPNTSMHGVEELVLPEYLFRDRQQYKLITNDEQIITKNYQIHFFEGYEQRYDRIRHLLPPEGIVRTSIFESTTYIIDCATFWETALKKLQSDPLFFVNKHRSGF